MGGGSGRGLKRTRRVAYPSRPVPAPFLASDRLTVGRQRPGINRHVTLDRCYKGRAHLICVFTALNTEAKSLTGSYTKIVDAKYPDLTTVDGICRIGSQNLAADIAGSEDFAKRFKELQSQYAAATICVANVEQAFKNVTLNDMTQAPEVLRTYLKIV
jgi:hypothetical protein